MKLLSTLITTLALIASVFTAPKAMAERINITGKTGINVIFDDTTLYDWLIDFSDNEGNTIHLDLPKGWDGDEPKTFEGEYKHDNPQFGGNGIYTYDSYYEMYYTYVEATEGDLYFTALTINTTGDPFDESSVWTIVGNGKVCSGFDDGGNPVGTIRDIHFYCDKNGGDDPSLAPEPTEDVITISPAGYATYCNASHAVSLPEGVTGYVAYLDGSNCKFTPYYSSTTAIGVGVPVVLNAEPGEYHLVYTQIGSGYDYNRLRPSGVDAQTMQDDDENCVFYSLTYGGAGDTGSVGFYWRADDGAAFDFTEEGKAYLALPKSAGARPSIIFAEEISGITNINAEKAVPAELYNIMGIRMQEAKGLVVRDGKMLFVK